MENTVNKTTGEAIVRHDFNPSGVGNVNFFKESCAKCIDALEQIKDYDERLYTIAVQKFEEASMYAVKLATAKS